jgi:hypothetical protein
MVQSTESIILKEVKADQDLLDFIRLPWKIYKGDPHWVPPLIKDQVQKFSPGHPFFSHAEMALFLAFRNEEIVGRIAAIIDRHFVEYHQEKTGFFGFFESIPEAEVAGALFDQARAWLKSRGMEKMAGPMNPSTNDECALLIDGFDSPPCLMMPYNPRYYPDLAEGAGLKKTMDLYAYLLEASVFRLERLNRITERLGKRDPQLRLRPINLRQLDRELTIVKEVYNQAWSRNWGFVPLTEAEIDDMARNLKPLLVPDLVVFAFCGEEPVGFSVAIPDYNEVLKRLNGKIGLMGSLKFLYYSRKIHKIRVMLLGVKQTFRKKGIEGFLYIETFKRGVKNGYYTAECSWILESNPLMQHGLEAMGGRRYKTYRIYDTPL